MAVVRAEIEIAEELLDTQCINHLAPYQLRLLWQVDALSDGRMVAVLSGRIGGWFG